MSSLPESLHRQMVDRLVAEGYARTPAVEAVLRAVPRHLFMPWAEPEIAYDWERTASREEGHPSAPNVVAHWLELAMLAPGQNVLEIGASTGYSAALTSLLVGAAGRVTTVEISPLRLDQARRRLEALGFANVYPVLADGFDGYPDHSPYDRILVTAAPGAIARAWGEQLREGGVLLVPFALRGAHLSFTLRLQRDGDTLTGGVASPIYLFWVGMQGRFPFWAEERLDPLLGLLRRAIPRRGLPREVPAPDLREPVQTEVNLLIFVLLDLEARGITLASFNDLPVAEAGVAVETILDRWEMLGRPGFWSLRACVLPADGPAPSGCDYAIARGDTVLCLDLPRRA
jgi:protein-L-isoaspartate(D-aspartate) O-methyltransferase